MVKYKPNKQNKERILKAAREEKQQTPQVTGNTKGKPIRMIASLFMEI